MILQNRDYESRDLMKAVERNNQLLIEDKSRWFYRKWRHLMINSGRVSRLENQLEERMRHVKDIYRWAYERGMQPYPTAVPFVDHKRRMGDEDDTLMEIFRRLPKGGLLHVHSAAALSVEGLIDLLKDFIREKELPTIYIETAGAGAGKMSYQAAGTETQIPLQTFFLSFQRMADAEAKLKDWLTIGPHTDGNPYIWDEFNQIFLRTSDLFTNETFYYEYHLRFFLECLQDRIDYVELRCGFQEFSDDGNSRQANVVMDQSPRFLDLLTAARDEAVKRYQDDVCAQKWKLPLGEMGLGVILCARRDLNAEVVRDREKLMKKMDTAIVWKKGAYAKLIAGFDFVSEEDRGKTSYSYYQDIYYGTALSGYTTPALQEEAARLKKMYDPDGHTRVELIDLMLHAGESLWMEQENIIDAKIASRWRIGHGFQLLEYPGALTRYAARSIDEMPCGPVLEVCPISNQMLRYFPDIRNHYALLLMKLGVPCVLGNDDPQILENPGLSYDFWEIYLASEGGLMLIKGLVFTAFLFHYQHRIGEPLETWDEDDYEACRMTFEGHYWEPFLEEIQRHLDQQDETVQK
ncbi:MAG: hypothetical protein NC302_04545 [Bacteroidales bacterium]|nr:hypothetical protein [Bacteroidales bacterium]MCM1415632.1 hypothetical protein [bacterium]MCM1422952.1 hypothetical protein [bacterium]